MSANLTLKVVEDLNGDMFGDQARTGVSTAGTSTLLTGLVASWPLDTTSDASGRGNTLTNNSATFGAGKIGTAAYFNATGSQFLSIADNADVSTGDADWTIGLWAYSTAGADGIMVGKDNATAGNREYNIRIASGGIQVDVYASGDTANTRTWGAGMTGGVWYCVVAWYDAAADTLGISVDDATPQTQSSIGPLQASGTAPMNIGARDYSGAEGYWDGRIDDVNKWSRVLTAGERTEFYNTGTGKEYPF